MGWARDLQPLLGRQVHVYDLDRQHLITGWLRGTSATTIRLSGTRRGRAAIVVSVEILGLVTAVPRQKRPLSVVPGGKVLRFGQEPAPSDGPL